MSDLPLLVPPEADRLLAVLRTRAEPVPLEVIERECRLNEVEARRQAEVLKELEYELAVLPDGSLQLLRAPDRLLPAEVRRYLATHWLGHEMRCFEVVDSTNTVARDLARAGAAQGVVVTAEAQRQGRGRMGRSWVSPARKNVYLSVLLRPPAEVEHPSQISLLAGLATCEAVSEWANAAIKWPNDILVQDRKLAGILTEMEGEGTNRFVILGIGVNLNAEQQDFPPDLLDKAGSIRMATGRTVDRPRFTAQLLTALERQYDRWCAEGFAPIARAWQERSCLNGRRIVVDAPEGRLAGLVLGLDSDGALRIELAPGVEHRIIAGDVSVVG